MILVRQRDNLPALRSLLVPARGGQLRFSWKEKGRDSTIGDGLGTNKKITSYFLIMLSR